MKPDDGIECLRHYLKMKAKNEIERSRENDTCDMIHTTMPSSLTIRRYI